MKWNINYGGEGVGGTIPILEGHYVIVCLCYDKHYAEMIVNEHNSKKEN
jgi:hypothetical protein